MTVSAVMHKAFCAERPTMSAPDGDDSGAPMVSIIIPTYNRSEVLKKTIDAVMWQTYQRFEIIVTDSSEDASTRNVLKGFDERVRYMHVPKRKGFRNVSEARNVGIRNAKGTLIAFLDDDDVWYPQKLEKQVDLLRRSPPEVGLVYCGFKRLRSPGGELLKVDVPQHRGNVLQEIMRQGFILTLTVLVRKECFDQAGLFDESLELAEDWDMWLRIGKKYHFDFVPDILAEYLIRDNPYGAWASLKAWEAVFFKHIPDMDERTLGHDYHRLSISHYLLGDKRSAKKYSAMALSHEKRWNYVLARLLYPFGLRTFRTVLKITGR